MRRRALRHGDARAAGRVRADLGHAGAAVLAGGDRARAGASPGLLLHGRGLLGPRMDAAAAGLRLRVRQAAVRPTARGSRAAGARALPRRARLPGQARPVPGEPRRAARRGDVRARTCTRQRRSSRFSRRACGFFIRASSRAARSASRRTSCAAPEEPVDADAATVLRPAAGGARGSRSFATANGGCSNASPAWDGNWTWDCFIALSWQAPGGERLLVAVNYAGNQGQCYVRLPFPELAGRAGAAQGSDGSRPLRSRWK